MTKGKKLTGKINGAIAAHRTGEGEDSLLEKPWQRKRRSSVKCEARTKKPPF